MWLLFSQRRVPKSAGGATKDVGHVWDGDLRELNTSPPRWWMWMFLLACIFSVGYLVPVSGSWVPSRRRAGLLLQGQLAAHRQAAEKMQSEIYGKYIGDGA